jgi:cell wall-associated NlpC family hydrolase
VSAALSRLGTPYRWGGTTPAGFDCSGLMLWSWAHAGVSLPRTSGAQRAYTQRISFNQLQPGDLIFSGNPVYHVGMYIGGGQMVHSPQTGDVAKISSVRTGGSTSYGRVP